MILKSGILAYFDSMTGLVPCKVLSVEPCGNRGTLIDTRVCLQVTASRPGFVKGESIITNAFHAVPRGAVRFRKYGTRIARYETICDY